MYHVSSRFLGDEVWLTPRVPATVNKVKEDATTARICISPTVEQCLLGIDGIKVLEKAGIPRDGLFVYETKSPGIPSGVFDSNITGECWLLEPTMFQFIGVVTWIDPKEQSRIMVRDSQNNVVKTTPYFTPTGRISYRKELFNGR